MAEAVAEAATVKTAARRALAGLAGLVIASSWSISEMARETLLRFLCSIWRSSPASRSRFSTALRKPCGAQIETPSEDSA
jgi:hypothetical protein